MTIFKKPRMDISMTATTNSRMKQLKYTKSVIQELDKLFHYCISFERWVNIERVLKIISHHYLFTDINKINAEHKYFLRETPHIVIFNVKSKGYLFQVLVELKLF